MFVLKFGEICEEDGFMKNIIVDELEFFFLCNDLSVFWKFFVL